MSTSGEVVSTVDVVILTAITLEYQSLLRVDAGALPGSKWERAQGPNGLPVASRIFEGKGGQQLRVLAAQAGDMGAVAATNALLPLVEKYRPKCVAMCGVCAGRPEKTQLGNVIVAERLFFHDTGKQLPNHIEQDLKTYNLRDDWKVAIENTNFVDRFRDELWWQERPIPYAWQEHWVLTLLAAEVNPSSHPERSKRCPQWEQVLRSLWDQRYIRKGLVRLTARGHAHAQHLRALYPDGFPDLSPNGKTLPFKVQVAPMGSGNKVVEDKDIWSFVSMHMRKTLSIEMEAAALGAIAHSQRERHLDALVMKGVMDFANHGRDDHFKDFAARASAECLLAFLREHLVGESTGTSQDPTRIVRRMSEANIAGTSRRHMAVSHNRMATDFIDRPALNSVFREFLNSDISCLPILGDPGLGKSALLSKWSGNAAEAGWVPFLLELAQTSAEAWHASLDAALQVVAPGRDHRSLSLLSEACTVDPSFKVLLFIDNLERHIDPGQFLHGLQRDLGLLGNRVRAIVACRRTAWPFAEDLRPGTGALVKVGPLNREEAEAIYEQARQRTNVSLAFRDLPRELLRQCWNPLFITFLVRTISLGATLDDLSTGAIIDRMFGSLVSTSAARRLFLVDGIGRTARRSSNRRVPIRDVLESCRVAGLPLSLADCDSADPKTLLGFLVHQGVLEEEGNDVGCTHDYVLEYLIARSIADDLKGGAVKSVVDDLITSTREPVLESLRILPAGVETTNLELLAAELLSIIENHTRTETKEQQEEDLRTRSWTFINVFLTSYRQLTPEALEQLNRSKQSPTWAKMERAIEALGRLSVAEPTSVAKMFIDTRDPAVVNRVFLRLFQIFIIDAYLLERICRHKDNVIRIVGFWIFFEMLERSTIMIGEGDVQAEDNSSLSMKGPKQLQLERGFWCLVRHSNTLSHYQQFASFRHAGETDAAHHAVAGPVVDLLPRFVQPLLSALETEEDLFSAIGWSLIPKFASLDTNNEIRSMFLHGLLKSGPRGCHNLCLCYISMLDYLGAEEVVDVALRRLALCQNVNEEQDLLALCFLAATQTLDRLLNKIPASSGDDQVNLMLKVAEIMKLEQIHDKLELLKRVVDFLDMVEPLQRRLLFVVILLSSLTATEQQLQMSAQKEPAMLTREIGNITLSANLEQKTDPRQLTTAISRMLAHTHQQLRQLEKAFNDVWKALNLEPSVRQKISESMNGSIIPQILFSELSMYYESIGQLATAADHKTNSVIINNILGYLFAFRAQTEARESDEGAEAIPTG